MADKLVPVHTPAGAFNELFHDNGDGSFSRSLPIAPSSTATATIANGASLSAAVDLGGKWPAALCMPAAWTAAPVTFQVSNDNVTFYNLYTAAGVEYSVTVGVDRCVVLPPSDMMGVRYLKVRSGTAGTPVNQAAERQLVLVLRNY